MDTSRDRAPTATFDRVNRQQEGRATLAAVLWAMGDAALQEMLLAGVFDGEVARLQAWAEYHGLEVRLSRNGRRLLVQNADVLAREVAGDDSIWTRDSARSLGYLDNYEYFRVGRFLYRAPAHQPIVPLTQRRRGARRASIDPEDMPRLTNRDGSPKYGPPHKQGGPA